MSHAFRHITLVPKNIVDALDECPNKPGMPSQREKALQLVKKLVDLRHPDIRVCITSRPEVDIRMVLEPLASHSVSLHDERKDDTTTISSQLWRPTQTHVNGEQRTNNLSSIRCPKSGRDVGHGY